MEDENYPNSLSYVLEEKNVIVLRTFSKIAGIAGVRIGTPYENKKFIQALKKIMSS